MTRILKADIVTGGNWQVYSMEKNRQGEQMW